MMYKRSWTSEKFTEAVRTDDAYYAVLEWNKRVWSV